MKKHLVYLFSALILAGCAKQIELTEPSKFTDATDMTSDARTRSLDGAVYNEIIGAWMVQEGDPYTLDNFQRAYDNLVARKSTQTLTKAQAAEFAVSQKLKPTHYALKIYPRNEEEQWRVEKMEDVSVVYAPFNFSILTEQETKRVLQTRSEVAGVFERSPYTVTYEDYETTEGVLTEPQTLRLPILYTVWPIDKPLPRDLEYKVDYEVFLPHKANPILNIEALGILQNEALVQELGYLAPVPVMVQTEATRSFATSSSTTYDYYTIKGRLVTYDRSFRHNFPLSNMEVMFQLGSSMTYIQLDNAGCFFYLFQLPATTNYGDLVTEELLITYKGSNGNSSWKITNSSGINPWIQAVPTTLWVTNDGTYVPDNVPATVVSSLDCQLNDIHRAANYFFRDQTVFPKETPSGGLRIIANSASTSANVPYNGLFSYSSSGCHINIYNHGNASGNVIGTTLHELGHFAHFKNFGYSILRKIPHLMLESFASYTGSYLGEKYYVSQGITPPGIGESWTLTGNERQGWHKNYMPAYDHRWYSPLFVDLTDTCNQKTASMSPNSPCPNDEIQGVPASVVWNVVSTSTDWAQCRAKLQSYVGTYYTATAFNNWIADFDYWFAQPAHKPY